MSPDAADNVTIYSYTAITPSTGHCEFLQIGPVGEVKELGNMLFALVTAAQGLFGLVTCRRINISSRYMFSLLFGFGMMSALHSATLWNGFKKTAGAILNLMQAIIIVTLTNSLRFPPFSNHISYAVGDIVLLTAGLYPIVTHVLGSSYQNDWISWLTFDGIWAFVLALAITIFVLRKNYTYYKQYPHIFYTLWLATGCVIAAYIFWLVDRFACSFPVAVIYPLGLWYVFIGLGFYYLTVLNAFIHAGYNGYRPSVWYWPQTCCPIVIIVTWDKLPLESSQEVHAQSISLEDENTSSR